MGDTATQMKRCRRLTGGLFTIEADSQLSRLLHRVKTVMMTPCWETHGRLAAVGWTAIKQVFTADSIVALWGLMTSKQSHDGLLLPFPPTKSHFIHIVLTDRPDEHTNTHTHTHTHRHTHTHSIALSLFWVPLKDFFNRNSCDP